MAMDCSSPRFEMLQIFLNRLISGFPIGVENMGDSSKFDVGGGLELIHEGAWGLKTALLKSM